jgi:hypothetical protein
MLKRAKPDDSASSSGDEQQDASKLTRITRANEPNEGYSCNLPPTCFRKPSVFPTAAALEAHHRSKHAYTCSEPKCSKIFPDERYLTLHLDECHNPLLAIRAERGEKTVRG